MKGWVIRWTWIGDYAAVETPDVMVLSARKSAEEVMRLVEFLYAVQSYSLAEQLDMARYNKPTPNPYPAEFVGRWQGAISCGHNPSLEAFVAENIRLEVDGSGTETITYDRVKPPSR